MYTFPLNVKELPKYILIVNNVKIKFIFNFE